MKIIRHIKFTIGIHGNNPHACKQQPNLIFKLLLNCFFSSNSYELRVLNNISAISKISFPNICYLQFFSYSFKTVIIKLSTSPAIRDIVSIGRTVRRNHFHRRHKDRSMRQQVYLCMEESGQ